MGFSKLELIFLCFLLLSATYCQIHNNDDEVSCTLDDGSPGVCVIHYLCDQNRTLITDGATLIKLRTQNVRTVLDPNYAAAESIRPAAGASATSQESCESHIHTCCKPPQGTGEGGQQESEGVDVGDTREKETDVPSRAIGVLPRSLGACVFPPYPKHGTYKSPRFPNARPGQSRDSFVLTVSCRRGFGVVSPGGGDGGTQQVYCVNGEWLQEMPQCVQSEGVDVGDTREKETDVPSRAIGVLPRSLGACVFPPYPKHGTYKSPRFPNARPGQSRDSFVLTVSCRRGFGVVSPGGGDGGTQQVYCVNGEWLQEMPQCVRFCKLDPHPSVNYLCHKEGTGFRTCQKYVAPGTLVQPACNGPIYYSAERLPYMKCTAGYWDYVAKCKAECGRVTPEGTQLLIDGAPAKRGELPWHVGVYRKTTRPYMQICGGSLISNNVVVSAAHCFWTGVKKDVKSSEFAVAIGKLHRQWNSEEDVGAQKSEIKEIKIPSLFQGEAANFQEDIAVLILSTAFVYKTYVRPVCLSFDSTFDAWQLRQDNLGKVAGWGLTTSNGGASQVLKVVELPFINADICISTLPLSFREYITGDKFCAGYTNGTALCQGDSGGGLSFPDKELGIDRYYLRGVVSAAPSSADKLCNDQVYTTFTKVTKHQDFINEALSSSQAKSCSLYSFQCDDGTCVEPGADCNGIKECPDGSDEVEQLCVAV